MRAPIYRNKPHAKSPFDLQLVGWLDGDGSFAYDPNYLKTQDAGAISLSLPLTESPFSPERSMPYFQGLLPEGSVLAALAAAEGKLERDYVELLLACGLDCVGDVVIDPGRYSGCCGYISVDLGSLRQNEAMTAAESGAQMARVHLSLAGTQSKFGLYHDPNEQIEKGWYQPEGGAPSNAIVKVSNESHPRLAVLEQIAMAAARGCGLSVASTALLNPDSPLIVSLRFDRVSPSGERVDGLEVPMRAHQEDMAQAFGVAPSAKYEELSGGTYAAIAQLLRTGSVSPAADVRTLAMWALYNYLIGNCDNHLKNLSISYVPNWGAFCLSPAYDIVPTTSCGAEFSDEMGMSIGGVCEIGAVGVRELYALAEDMHVKPEALKRVARNLIEALPREVDLAGKELCALGFDGAIYLADNLMEDAAARMSVLAKFCEFCE